SRSPAYQFYKNVSPDLLLGINIRCLTTWLRPNVQPLRLGALFRACDSSVPPTSSLAADPTALLVIDRRVLAEDREPGRSPCWWGTRSPSCRLQFRDYPGPSSHTSPSQSRPLSGFARGTDNACRGNR